MLNKSSDDITLVPFVCCQTVFGFPADDALTRSDWLGNVGSMVRRYITAAVPLLLNAELPHRVGSEPDWLHSEPGITAL